MTLVIPPGYASVLHSLRLSGDADPYAITYGVTTTAADAAAANTLAANLHGIYDANFGPINPAILSLVETVVRVQVAPGDPPVLGVATTNLPGDGASTSLVPQNTALLVHKRTSFGGQTGRGRMYFPALNEANVDAVGNISGTWLSTVNTALAAFLTDVNGTATVDTMVLLHDSNGAGALLDPYPITSLSCDPIAASQRRRLRK